MSLSIIPGPAGQFLDEMHEFSEVVLARMSLMNPQSYSVLPVGNSLVGELWRKKVSLRVSSARLGTFHLNSQNQFFSASHT